MEKEKIPKNVSQFRNFSKTLQPFLCFYLNIIDDWIANTEDKFLALQKKDFNPGKGI